MLHQLIYYSDARGVIDTASVNQILTSSRRNNAMSHISGLLLFLEGRFFQVLEGPPAQLKTTFQRIGKDPRHKNVQIVASSPIRARAFPMWSMGYTAPERLSAEARNSAFALSEIVPINSERRGDDPKVRQAVRTFMTQFEKLRV